MSTDQRDNGVPFMAYAVPLQELSLRTNRDDDEVSSDGVVIVSKRGQRWVPFEKDGELTGCVESHCWSYSVTHKQSKNPDDDCSPLHEENCRNKYTHIISGYRSAPMNIRHSIISLFQVHNETMNVWTHIIGAVLFVQKLVQLIIRSDPFPEYMTTMDIFVIGFYLVSAVVCMSFSAAFHLLSSSSDAWFGRLEVLDHFGILLLMFGSNLPMIFYGFYDRLEWQIAYLSCSALGVTAANLILSFQKLKEFRGLKIFVFVGVAVIGWCQLAHDIVSRGGLEAQSSQGALDAWVKTFAWYILGVFFYIFQVPERLKPGLFDIVGSSHQIWHVCVVLGALQHIDGCLLYGHLAGAFASRV